MPDWRVHPLLRFDSVKRWMNTKQQQRDPYKYRCLDALDKYCKYRVLNPDQIIKEYIEARKLDPPARLLPEDKLNAWAADITDNGKVKLYWAANLQRQIIPFFDKNGCHVDIDVEMPSAPARENTIQGTPEITKRFLDSTPRLDFKWPIICMAENGMRPGSVMQLRYRHIKRSLEAREVPLAIQIPGKITKTGQPYTTFVLEDAVEIIREHLKTIHPLTGDTPIISYSTTRLIHYVPNLGVELGYNQSKGLKPFTCGSWRSWAQDAFEGAGVPQNRVSLLMGARPHGRDAHYVNPPIKVLAQEYMKAAPQLRIYE